MRWAGVLMVALGCTEPDDLTGTYQTAGFTVSQPCDATPMFIESPSVVRFARDGDNFGEAPCNDPSACFNPELRWTDIDGVWTIENASGLGTESSCGLAYRLGTVHRNGNSLVKTHREYREGPIKVSACTEAEALRRGTSMKCSVLARTEYTLVE